MGAENYSRNIEYVSDIENYVTQKIKFDGLL